MTCGFCQVARIIYGRRLQTDRLMLVRRGLLPGRHHLELTNTAILPDDTSMQASITTNSLPSLHKGSAPGCRKVYPHIMQNQHSILVSDVSKRDYHSHATAHAPPRISSVRVSVYLYLATSFLTASTYFFWASAALRSLNSAHLLYFAFPCKTDIRQLSVKLYFLSLFLFR